MKTKRLGINAILNVIRSTLSIIFPLITYPYALRVIGVKNIGAVSYVTSIVNYFSLFAMLGVSSYAIREGAKVRDNQKKFNIFANEVFSINIITTSISVIVFILVVMCVPEFRKYVHLFAILGLSIVFTTIGVDWINTIYEDYLFITVRGIIVQLISLILLFCIVKGPQDYLKYAFLQIFSSGFIAISNWIHCRKYAKVKIVLHPDIKKHLPRLLILFSNSLAISIYVNFDTTMLGWIKDAYDVGIYSTSVKIYSAIKSVMMSIYSVAIPRLAAMYGKQDIKGFKNLYTKLWAYLAILLIPAGIGLICVSKEVILVFGGRSYIDGVQSLRILAGALIFSIFGGLITTCLNITINREKDNLMSTILSSLLNCGLNFIFIPLWSYNGAAVTTLFAELFVLVFCFIRVPNKEEYMDLRNISKKILEAIIACIPILFVAICVHTFINNYLISLLLIVVFGGALYFLGLILFRNEELLGSLKILKNKF